MSSLIRLAGFVGVLWVAYQVSAQEPAAPDLKDLHRGKAGVYVRLSTPQWLTASAAAPGAGAPAAKPRRRANARPTKKQADKGQISLLLGHPLLDAVMLHTHWRMVEPQHGSFSFDHVLNEVNRWGQAGKGVVMGIELYGQKPDAGPTPAWLYQQPGVRGIPFHGGGEAKGQMIRIPAVWDPGFLEKYVEPLVREFARAVDGNPHVWYIQPGFGHIGNMTANPSKEGGPALLQAGFTGPRWADYCRRTMSLYRKYFKKTPLLMVATAMVIRDKHHDNYQGVIRELLAEFGQQGTTVIHYDIEGERERVAGAMRDVAPVIPAARAGKTRLGLGDDWPLWVPESRRDQGPTLHHDDNYFRKVLDYAFGGVEGLPPVPTTILACQLPELEASNPRGADYRPAVGQLLQRARDRLKKNDEEIFGTRSGASQGR
jgi:hypothetical protein